MSAGEYEHDPESWDGHAGSTSRRGFLEQVSAITAAGAAASTVHADAAASTELLPTIELGRYQVTRLMLGGNPIYGYSHFNRLYSQQLIDFHTPERVVELLRACAAAGINTWQNSYTRRTVDDVHLCREALGQVREVLKISKFGETRVPGRI